MNADHTLHQSANISLLRNTLVVLSFGTVVGTSLCLLTLPMAIASIVLGILMITGATIDAETYTLPNPITAATLLAGLAFAFLLHPDGGWLRVVDSLVQGFATATALGIVRAGYVYLRGREGLGLGDVKLAAGIGAWLPLEAIPVCIGLAAVSGLIWLIISHLRGHHIGQFTKLPLGSFLCPSLWLVFVLTVQTTTLL